MALVETYEGVSYDRLIGGGEITVLTENRKLTSGQKIKRGTLLSVSSGKLIATINGGQSYAIAAEDADATNGDIVTTVYVRGRFNREGIIVASGDTVESHENELKDIGIFLTSIKG